MSRQIDWYFDFISPFAYLQSQTLHEQLPSESRLRCRPVLFAGLLSHWQHKGPAELPTKRRFTYRHVQWLARRHGIPLRFPPSHPFHPVRALRLAVALGCRPEVVDTIFTFIWAEGRDPNEPANWRELAQRLGVADADALVNAPEVKAQLKRFGEEALAAGVFGVPSLVIDGELFWGFDATAMARDFLEDPSWLRSGEFSRIDELPAGVMRKEAGG